jgi:hypothetical protein
MVDPAVHAVADKGSHDVWCVLLLQVEVECLESHSTSSAVIFGLASEDVIGVFPQLITGKAVAIRSVVESLQAT